MTCVLPQLATLLDCGSGRNVGGRSSCCAAADCADEARTADARELLAAEHGHDAGAADAGFHEDDAGWVGGDFADDRSVAAEWCARMAARVLSTLSHGTLAGSLPSLAT